MQVLYQTFPDFLQNDVEDGIVCNVRVQQDDDELGL